jgi:signal transduction histidine kinase
MLGYLLDYSVKRVIFEPISDDCPRQERSALKKKFFMTFNDPALERAYQSLTGKERKTQMRFGLLMPSILYVIISFIDPMVLDDSIVQLASNIHLGQGLLILILVLFAFKIRSMVYHFGIVSSAVIIAWSSHLYMTGNGALHELAGEGYLMVIWLWLVSGLNVRQASVMTLVFIIEFVLYQYFNPMPLDYLPIYLYLMFAAALFGITIALLTDYHRRQAFLSEQKHRRMESQFIQSQKMEAIGTLAGGIAHDFNNTLAAITGNIYLVKQQIEHNPKTLAMLESIEEVSFRSASIIKQLLAFSRKGLIQMRSTELSTLLETTAQLYQVSVPVNMQFEFRNRVGGELLIHGDDNQLEQVVFNLLNNARDAAADVEKPVITLELDRWKADESFLAAHAEMEAGDFARISIFDNGCGISESDLANIFEPFFTTKTDGTGLGLSMAIGSIQSHGGVLTAEARPEGGTCFRIYLPELKQEADRQVQAEHEVTSEGDGDTILVVDDNG